MSTQAKDKIRYNDKDMTLKGARLLSQESGYLSPLVFLKEERGIIFNPIQANTGNYRGFTCGWEFTFKEGELVEEKKRYVWTPRPLKDYIED